MWIGTLTREPREGEERPSVGAGFHAFAAAVTSRHGAIGPQGQARAGPGERPPAYDAERMRVRCSAPHVHNGDHRQTCLGGDRVLALVLALTATVLAGLLVVTALVRPRVHNDWAMVALMGAGSYPWFALMQRVSLMMRYRWPLLFTPLRGPGHPGGAGAVFYALEMWPIVGAVMLAVRRMRVGHD